MECQCTRECSPKHAGDGPGFDTIDAVDPSQATAELVDRIEATAPELRGRQAAQLAALAELRGLSPAIEQALADARERGDRVQTMRMLAALARFWWIDGQARTIEPWVDWVWRGRKEYVEPSLLAAAHQGAGELAYARADYRRATGHLQQAHSGCLSLGQVGGQAAAINWLGMVAREQGRYDRAIACHQQAEEHYRQIADQWGCAHARSNLGVVAFRREQFEDATKLHGEALVRRRAIDDLHGISSSLGNLALIRRRTGELARARALYQESLRARELLGDRWGIAGSAVCLCAVDTALGEVLSAHTYFSQAVHGFIAVGDNLGLAESAEAAMALFLGQGKQEMAARAYRSAVAMRRLIETPMHADARRVAEQVREAAGVETWAAAATVELVRQELVQLAANNG